MVRYGPSNFEGGVGGGTESGVKEIRVQSDVVWDVVVGERVYLSRGVRTRHFTSAFENRPIFQDVLGQSKTEHREHPT